METPAPDTSAPVSGTTPAPVTVPILRARFWALAVVAALVAGLVAFALGEVYRDRFVPPERWITAMGMKMNLPTFAMKAAADRKNASLANGLLGGFLGLGLGLAGGLARRSGLAALVAGGLGAVIGSAAGVGSAELALPVYYQKLDTNSEELSADLVLPLLIRVACWALVGVAAGAALAVGAGTRRKILAAAACGLIGAAVAAGAYELVGAFAFPTFKTNEPLASHWAPRLVSRLLPALFVAVLAAFAVVSEGRTAPKAPGDPS